MQASSTSPATLSQNAGYRVLGCACLLEFVRASKTPGGDPDTQDANGSTELSTRHLRWAEARAPLGAAGASSRAFVPGFGYHYSGQSFARCLGECGASGGRVVVLSSRCGERYMPGAQEEERAVGDGVLQSFYGALRVVE